MKYLVDANVLSEPTKPSPDPRVVDWLRAHEPDMAVNSVILGELRFGILILPTGKKRTAIDQARMQMLQQYLAAVLNVHLFGSGNETMLATARAAYCGSSASAMHAATKAR